MQILEAVRTVKIVKTKIFQEVGKLAKMIIIGGLLGMISLRKTGLIIKPVAKIVVTVVPTVVKTAWKGSELMSTKISMVARENLEETVRSDLEGTV